MASDLNQQLERVRSKALVLSQKYNVLRQSYEDSRREISDLKAKILVRDEEIKRLKVKVEFLTVSSGIKASADDIKAARDMIADLMREIDQCIADLLE